MIGCRAREIKIAIDIWDKKRWLHCKLCSLGPKFYQSSFRTRPDLQLLGKRPNFSFVTTQIFYVYWNKFDVFLHSNCLIFEKFMAKLAYIFLQEFKPEYA